MGLLALAGEEVFVAAVDFDEAFQGAAVLQKEPCGLDRTAPSGGEGEVVDAVVPHAGNQGFHILVPDHLADVEVDVAAVSGDLIFSPDAAGCATQRLDGGGGFVVKGSCCFLARFVGGCVVGLEGFLYLCVGLFKNVHHGIVLLKKCSVSFGVHIFVLIAHYIK